MLTSSLRPGVQMSSTVSTAPAGCMQAASAYWLLIPYRTGSNRQTGPSWPVAAVQCPCGGGVKPAAARMRLPELCMP